MADTPFTDAAARKAFAEIRANVETLNACPRHRFDCGEPVKFGATFKCSNCGGTMRQLEARQYVLGYKAAGGKASDIFPDWDG